MFEISISDEGVSAALQRLATAGQKMGPVFKSISLELLAETVENFEAEGRPKWLGLAPSTVRRRSKAGTWPGKILSVSAGGLAASVSADSGTDYARVGSNKKYAAIHQFGGKAGRGRKVTIPARAYLPIDASGNMTPDAREAAMAMVTHYLRGLVKP